MSKTIETSKIKTKNHEELEKSINEERDLKNKMDKFTMLTTINRNDGDDNVNSDVVQGRSEVESKEKDKMNISKQIIMDEETEQLENLNTDIETTKRKSTNHEELDKSINKEIDLNNTMDEFTMLTKINKNDGDDNVNIDVVQRRSEVEFEETTPMNIQMNINKRYALA